MPKRSRSHNKTSALSYEMIYTEDGDSSTETFTDETKLMHALHKWLKEAHPRGEREIRPLMKKIRFSDYKHVGSLTIIARNATMTQFMSLARKIEATTPREYNGD